MRTWIEQYVSSPQTGALFFLLAFGAIVRWRVTMWFDYRRLVSTPAPRVLTRYHMEMCRLLHAIARGETVELPAVLGATRFARPPSRLRWIRNHIARLMR